MNFVLTAAIILFSMPLFCSSHSIILYLANIASESSNAELHQSLSALYSVPLSNHPHYPVLVAYDRKDRGYLTPDLRQTLAERINATQRQITDFDFFSLRGTTTICFVSIRGFRHIPWPFSMYTDIYQEKDPYYSRLGYSHMCRYWALTVFSQPFMRNVTSYLRLDTDTDLVAMPANPFELLAAEPGLAYLASVAYKEGTKQAEGLWETLLRFAFDADIHPWGLAPLSNRHADDAHSDMDLKRMPLLEAVDVLYRRGYNRDYFYNNWEVSRVDIWTSPIYQRLAKHIDAAGGIIARRWGDAPIRTLSLFLLRDAFAAMLNSSSDQPPFRQYRGLRVYHKAYHTTGGSELAF